MASHPRASLLTALALGASLCLLAPAAHADADDALCPHLSEALTAAPGSGGREIFLSNYTKHWEPSDAHQRVLAVSLQQNLANDRFCGFSLFTNSFGQPSVYVFVGKSWPHFMPTVPELYASLSAGVLYGYVKPYQNKVPLNFGGFSPGIVPTLGYQITPNLTVQTQWLGFAAVMVGASLRY